MAERLDTLAGLTVLIYAVVFGYGIVTGSVEGQIVQGLASRALGIPPILAVAYILLRGGGFDG